MKTITNKQDYQIIEYRTFDRSVSPSFTEETLLTKTTSIDDICQKRCGGIEIHPPEIKSENHVFIEPSTDRPILINREYMVGGAHINYSYHDWFGREIAIVTFQVSNKPDELLYWLDKYYKEEEN